MAAGAEPGGTEPAEAGFTLLELLVVLGVLALVIAVALSHVPRGAEAAAVRAAAVSIADALRETRGLAIRDNRPVLFNIDVATRRWTVEGGRAGAFAPELALALETDRRLLQSREAGAIRFFGDGSASGGLVVISRGNTRVTVTVDWLTGRVAVDG